MVEPIVCYLTKYTMKSINSADSISAHNLSSALFADWPGQTPNGRGV